MKMRLLSFLTMLLCSVSALSQTFTVDGIKYNITSTDDLTVEVTSGGEYSGEIVIPASVQYDGNTYSVTSIGVSAFSGCNSLSSVEIPDKVLSIDAWAFWNCSALKTVALPSSLKNITGSAFEGCNNLTSIISKIKSLFVIQESVFTSTTYANATLTVPKGKKEQYQSVAYWSSFANIVESDEDEPITDEKKRTIHVETAGTLPQLIAADEKYIIEELTLTGELNGTDFRLIRDMAGCNYLGKWTGGMLAVLDLSGAKIVEGGEKYLDTDMVQVLWGSYVGTGTFSFYTQTDVVGNYLFCGCNLNSIILPNSVTTIERLAFDDCRCLTTITIPNSVTSIGISAFSGCRVLTSIAIPNSVTSIGGGAFQNCTGLTSVTIPSSVTSIGGYAFQGTAWYDSQSDGVVYAGKVAYKYKGEMPANTSIFLDEGTLGIGESAFSGCSGLTTVTIPNGVTSIGKYAFKGCIYLTSITIPNGVTSIGSGTFQNCFRLTSVTIPNGVTSIGSSAFQNCFRLTSVTIPNSVTSIEGNAFYYSIGGLTCVKVLLETPLEITSDVFTNRANATLYVPYGSKDFYEAANYWKEFKEIKEVEGMIDVSILDDALYAEDVTVYPDGATCLPILMKNKESITNIQFDVVLPEGVTIKNSTLTNRKGSDHTITTSSVNGATRFMVTSMGGKVFSDNDGAIINLSLAIDKNLAAGHQEITLRNVTLSTSGAVKVNTPTCMAVLTVSDIESGDADGDGVTDVNDVTSTINHILKKPVASFVRGAADVDGDNVIDVNDVQAIIDKALGKTSSSRETDKQEEEPALDPQ